VRGPCTFRQTDVKRAIKAALAAGLKVVRTEFHKDKFVLLTCGDTEQSNDLDQELSEFEKRHGPR
jgi:DNA polymerase IIIc chi subunit